MIDVPNSSFPYEGMRVAKRPKGKHLYRVFSMLNRAPLELFHFSQLIAWTNFEFDLRIDSYEAVNRWFDGQESSLFVAYYVRFMGHDQFFYIPDAKHPETAEAFQRYSKGANFSVAPLATQDPGHKSIEFWNKLKMLCLITQHREKMTHANLDRFSKSIFARVVKIGELGNLQEYGDSEAVAYVFELIRQGKYSLLNVGGELISLNSKIETNKPRER